MFGEQLRPGLEFAQRQNLSLKEIRLLSILLGKGGECQSDELARLSNTNISTVQTQMRGLVIRELVGKRAEKDRKVTYVVRERLDRGDEE